MTSLVVIGQGYVGLPMTLTAVEVAMTAVGFDTDNEIVQHLNSGQSDTGDVNNEALAAGSPVDTGRTSFKPE